jgi:formate-dependent nitrite reductase membrane component NrfD
VTDRRDMRPATGSRGGPGEWRRAREDADVALARPQWGDARWSFLYSETDYAGTEPPPGLVGEANRRGRAEPPGEVHGPIIKPPVWTWEAPLYMWVGGIAAGASFAALACDLAGDRESAATARKVALGAVAPAPLLLVTELGRPGRFLNMLRIFKPRSPMNMGAWCLIAFSSTGATAVGADLLGRRKTAQALGGATAVLGGYLGSYTGVLLACTAVPLWARSRLFLGPIFVATATATGAAATRLALSALGQERDHPTRRALSMIETGAIAAELALSTINDRRLGRLSEVLSKGRPGLLFRAARWTVIGGLALQGLRGRRPWAEHAASACYLAGGLAFRYAWVGAGRGSAHDSEAVALMAREAPETKRMAAKERKPLRGPAKVLARGWTEAVRRVSLAADGALR